jgi:tetraacyldisaccharide 4'-kinase
MNLTLVQCARQLLERADKGGPGWAPVRAFLLICSWKYGVLVSVRKFLYAHIPGMRKRVAAHVVSVGNITVGGSGKTPLVEKYAKTWLHKGKKVAIVSRGYGKSENIIQQSALPERFRAPEGVRVVSAGSGTVYLSAEEAGDEPHMLARRVPEAIVLVSRNRYVACRFAVEKLGVEVIVLDDAFQHLRLHRDEDVVAVDATNPFGNGHMLPRGILREPLTSLRRTTRVLITKILPGSDIDLSEVLNKVRCVAPNVSVSTTQYVPTHLSTRAEGDTLPLDHLKGKKVVAFCGIADPVFFERTLTHLGARVACMRGFPDHYRYTSADLASINKDAGENNADAIVTTQKDMVRLPDDLSTACPLYAVAVEIMVDS